MPSYRAIEKIMRVYGQRPTGQQLDAHSLAVKAELSEQTVRATLLPLEERRYVVLGGMGYVMPESARRHAGKNAAQFLALDVAKWTDESGKQFVRVADLPDEYRDDAKLLELALRELERFGAVHPHSSASTGLIDSFHVNLELTLYESESAGSQVAPVQVFQNIAEYVGRDKITNKGDGVVNTGDHATVTNTVNADAAESFRQFVEALRVQGEINAAALELLADAARPGMSPPTVRTLIAGAAAAQPGLGERVKGWFVGLAGRCGDEVIVAATLAYLKANGLL